MTTWETMQGGLISPTIFKLVVDNVVWTWLAMTVKYQTMAQEILGLNVGRFLVVFYTDNGMIRSWGLD